MVLDHHQFMLELTKLDGSPLGRFSVEPDWEPAREYCQLTALRSNKPNAVQSGVDVQIQPEWDNTVGQAIVSGVRVVLDGVSVVIPLSYFRRYAQIVSQTLIAEKRLEVGETFNFSVLAFPKNRVIQPTSRFAFDVEEVSPPSTIKPARLSDYQTRATEFGATEPVELPVYVPQTVIDEAALMTRRAEANEIGGILIGHLCRDTEHPLDLFVEITALIPAKHALSESTKLTFTAETWVAVEAALKLRRSNEQMLGWFHSHPAIYWCSANCSAEARRKCPLSRTFFSDEDCTLHRTVFPAAYSVAFLITNTDAGLRSAMFGWRQGMITQRGFSVLNATTQPAQADTAPVVIGGKHEKECD